MPTKSKVATFAGGCFWGVEEAFLKVPGVLKTKVGYAGGTTENPTYKEVCSGITGHAEAIEIYFDPEKTDYEQLLEIFWIIHDPTQVNRQGNDVGTQYRSIIFYHDIEQQEKAKLSIKKLNLSGKYLKPIATELLPAQKFWPAEKYHQKYLQINSGGYCHVNMNQVRKKISEIFEK
ncbi:MAG: peptide-methionine (S)-S-oxide reductase [Candidatus Lokiarchaeota archaeon]|nr:peptide-methionine (S)-S-oxide reductase [Candidatus Lokiarchaeota archaeon]